MAIFLNNAGIVNPVNVHDALSWERFQEDKSLVTAKLDKKDECVVRFRYFIDDSFSHL